MNAQVPSWLIREYSGERRVEFVPAATSDRRAGLTVLVDGEPRRIIIGEEQFPARAVALTHATAVAHVAAREFASRYGAGYRFTVTMRRP